MNNTLYAIYVILSSKEDNIYIISNEDKQLILPYKEITVPNKLKQESRYVVKNFFVEGTYKYSEECSYNFLDIQEENSLDYIQEINPNYQETDLYITYGGISVFNDLKPGLYWHKLIFNTDYFGYTTNKPLNLMIDNVINKTSL